MMEAIDASLSFMPENNFSKEGFGLAEGVLLMRPLALHASSKATGSSRRRVLHFVYGPLALPYGLRWPSIADTPP